MINDSIKHPFASTVKCPACGLQRDAFHQGFVMKFSNQEVVRGEKKFIDNTGLNSTRDPHLEVTCQRCGYQWLEHTYEHTQEMNR
jgi:hypothetical protein